MYPCSCLLSQKQFNSCVYLIIEEWDSLGDDDDDDNCDVQRIELELHDSIFNYLEKIISLLGNARTTSRSSQTSAYDVTNLVDSYFSVDKDTSKPSQVDSLSLSIITSLLICPHDTLCISITESWSSCSGLECFNSIS